MDGLKQEAILFFSLRVRLGYVGISNCCGTCGQDEHACGGTATSKILARYYCHMYIFRFLLITTVQRKIILFSPIGRLDCITRVKLFEFLCSAKTKFGQNCAGIASTGKTCL